MEPSPNRAKPLRYYELPPETFQVLCREALRQVPGVDDTQVYGVRGQRQLGIDILVKFPKKKLWVAQCKACQPSAARRNLDEAVDEFVPHAAHWRSRGADRFLVMIGCDSDDVKLQDDLPAYEAKLAALGFEFQLLGSDGIQRYLQDNPVGVATILGSEFVPFVCGMSATAAAPRVLFADGTARVTPNLIEELGAAHAERLDFFRELALKGEESKAEGELRTLLASEVCHLLPGTYRARALILLASLALSRRGDLDEAGRLLEAAKTEDPDGRFVALEAHLRQERDGVGAALGALPEPADIQEWHTRIVLLLNSNRVDEAVRQLDAPAFTANAETFRLGALAHLLRGDLETARARVKEAERRAGDHLAVLEAAAVVDYCSALSPAFFQEAQHRCLQWPLPTKWPLVRRDDEAVEALGRAAARFESIVVASEVMSDLASGTCLETRLYG
jgi:tetratricopeptide (TPR) repeat protein